MAAGVGHGRDTTAAPRRGHARRLLATALAWAAADPRVRTVRASISPTNVASLSTIRPFGFTHVGEQWDDEDGLELLYERPVPLASSGG